MFLKINLFKNTQITSTRRHITSVYTTQVVGRDFIFKVILYSYLILKKMNEHITDS